MLFLIYSLFPTPDFVFIHVFIALHNNFLFLTFPDYFFLEL